MATALPAVVCTRLLMVAEGINSATEGTVALDPPRSCSLVARGDVVYSVCGVEFEGVEVHLFGFTSQAMYSGPHLLSYSPVLPSPTDPQSYTISRSPGREFLLRSEQQNGHELFSLFIFPLPARGLSSVVLRNDSSVVSFEGCAYFAIRAVGAIAGTDPFDST